MRSRISAQYSTVMNTDSSTNTHPHTPTNRVHATREFHHMMNIEMDLHEIDYITGTRVHAYIHPSIQ